MSLNPGFQRASVSRTGPHAISFSSLLNDTLDDSSMTTAATILLLCSGEPYEHLFRRLKSPTQSHQCMQRFGDRTPNSPLNLYLGLSILFFEDGTFARYLLASLQPSLLLFLPKMYIP